MTTQALPLESKQLALELYAILHELDPSRWRNEKEEALRAKLQELSVRMSALLQTYSEHADQRLDNLKSRLIKMEAVLKTRTPQTMPSAEELREAWMSFRASAVPAYEELASSLKALDMRVPSLRPTNYMRNVFHVGIALACIGIVQLVPQLTSLGFWLVTIIAWSFALSGWALEIGRTQSERINAWCMAAFKHVAHPHEAHHVNSSTWYTTALALIALTHSPMLCSIALAILGVADPAAAIIGKRFGRTRFANGRSLEGTTAFVIVGTAGALASVLLLHPEISVANGAILSVSAALVAGITELNLKRIDDNLAVPVSAAIAATIMAWLLGVPF